MIRYKYLILLLIIINACVVTISAQGKVRKVHYLDKSHVWLSKGDSIPTITPPDSVAIYDWQVYYDKNFAIKLLDYYQRGDTTYIIYYYKNGRKKSEYRGLDEWRDGRYSAEWCENGQLIVERKDFYNQLQTFTWYYCNGQKKDKFQSNNFSDLWGLSEGWYENGVKAYEITYPEFDLNLYKQDLLKSEKISEVHWDSTGVETKRVTYK